MNRPITAIKQPDYTSYSEIIDVRSPSEFAEDHIPGAINLWVLDDEQRAEVGTLYKQTGAFEAKKVGAALMSRNIAHWLETHFHDKDKGYHPMVYCWRGGQRSGGMATILSRITWETHLLEGGYKNYRNQVRSTLDHKIPAMKLGVIAGLTGTAKTRILHQLKAAGEQIIDLEGLAEHKGSLLGSSPNKPQPSQKYFESLLAHQVKDHDPQRITWIEAESNKIGRIHCPEGLWKNMRTSAILRLEASQEERVRYLIDDYPHFVEQPEELIERLNFLRQLRGHETVDRWTALVKNREWPLLVADLLESHYDLSYSQSIKKNRRETQSTLLLESLDDGGLQLAAERIREQGQNWIKSGSH